jgi:DUF971 family protein
MVMPSAALQPTRVEVIGNDLALVWSDGKETYVPLEKLRRACPCATCGGEPDVMGRLVRPNVSYGAGSFELRGFRFVGGYALQPTWNDGHDTGLYSFRQLRFMDPSEEVRADASPAESGGTESGQASDHAAA